MMGNHNHPQDAAKQCMPPPASTLPPTLLVTVFQVAVIIKIIIIMIKIIIRIIITIILILIIIRMTIMITLNIMIVLSIITKKIFISIMTMMMIRIATKIKIINIIITIIINNDPSLHSEVDWKTQLSDLLATLSPERIVIMRFLFAFLNQLVWVLVWGEGKRFCCGGSGDGGVYGVG